MRLKVVAENSSIHDPVIPSVLKLFASMWHDLRVKIVNLVSQSVPRANKVKAQ
jgi:hypothetical protein